MKGLNMEDKAVKNPCDRDCPLRSDVCHGTCPSYKAYRDYKDRQLEKNNQRIQGIPEMTPKMKRYIARKRRWK